MHSTSRIRSALTVGLVLCLYPIAGLTQIDISSDLETIRANHKMPGMSAMAIKQGRIVASGAAGLRRQGQTTPLLVTDRINIASCTKWMTATIAGRLVDRGVINWTTRVRDLFPNYAGFHATFHDATLDQFLAHRTGVQQSSTFDAAHWSQLLARNGTYTEIRRWVSNTVLTDAPEVSVGTYLYANQGYAVAATMMELASGKSWETLMSEEIFEPARMTSASLGLVYGAELPPNNIVGHDLAAGAGAVPIPRAPMTVATQYRYQAAYGPGGHVACTLQDWAKFLHLHMTSDLSDYLAPATGVWLQQPFTGTTGYSRGISSDIRSWASPGRALSHTGDIFGHDTVVWAAPAHDFIAVIFTNCRSANNATSDALDAAATLLINRYAAPAAAGPLIELPSAQPLRQVSNQYAFDYLTLPGLNYIVKTSTDLINWTPANGVNGQTATSLKSTFLDSAPGTRKFYRAAIEQ